MSHEDLEHLLRRGQGLGTIEALERRDDPRTAELVYACVSHDDRWDSQVDLF